MRQIERYLRFFPRERFHFCFQTELKDTPGKLLEEIISFLGVENIDLTNTGIVKRNVGGSDYFIRSKTTRKLRRISLISSIADRMPNGLKDRMYTILKRSFIGRRFETQYQVPPMKPETRKALLKLFEKPNRELEAFLGVQIDSWYI